MKDFSKQTKSTSSRFKAYSDVGILIARKNYSESDRILVLFTRGFGRTTVIAKGVRKLKSRKRGHIEIFSLIKFQAVNGSSMDILTEAEIINDFSEVRGDLTKVSVAYFLVEIVGKLTRDNEPHLEIFELLKRYLQELKNSKSLKALRHEFTREALVILGFWPENKNLANPDMILESITEKRINSIRVGKKMIQQGKLR